MPQYVKHAPIKENKKNLGIKFNVYNASIKKKKKLFKLG
jgi:hypothetical protein